MLQNESDKFDVLLPFHEDNELLRKALKSVDIAAGHKRIILINDSGFKTSNSLTNIIKHSDYTVCSTPGKTGYGLALKEGSQHLQNNYVTLMNSDDLVHPLKFQIQLNEIGEADVIFTKMMKFGSRYQDYFPGLSEVKTVNYDYRFLFFGSYGANATWFCNKDWFVKNFFFDSKECLDWRIALNTFHSSKIKYINKTLYFYRQHSLQSTQAININYSNLYNEWNQNCYRLFNVKFEKDFFTFLCTPWVFHSKVEKETIDFFNSLVTTLNDDWEFKNQIRQFIRRRILIEAIKNSSLSFNFNNSYEILGGAFELGKEFITYTNSFFRNRTQLRSLNEN